MTISVSSGDLGSTRLVALYLVGLRQREPFRGPASLDKNSFAAKLGHCHAS
jgi:hypothetical protein